MVRAPYDDQQIMEFSERHLRQLQDKGISPEEAVRQLERFRTGMKYVDLARPARRGDGIMVLDEADKQRYAEVFRKKITQWQFVKFIPASGAATRMFKDLFECIDHPENGNASFDHLKEGVKVFAVNLPRMPFYDELMARVSERHPEFSSTTDLESIRMLVEELLLEEGMQYGSLPKALLTFHNYGHESRMPFEEHLVEWVNLLDDPSLPVHLHFTLSRHHLPLFEQELGRRIQKYQDRYERDFSITSSIQEPSTDTLAAAEDNQPFIDLNGNLLFRPGGHGALLFNLDTIDADMVYLKNIDNVAIEGIEKENLVWKEVLCGVLMETVMKVHGILKELDRGDLGEGRISEITAWIRSTFRKGFSAETHDLLKTIRHFLNRPVRVCGMVENTGEPGGGPFWVRDGNGVSLQIVESAQININDPDQKAIALQATHFNPVDIVCAVRDYKGVKFNLQDYSDPDTSFISVKSHQGRVLKALEHPGLWNGAMGHWLTLFVEVPLQTFNPVKTVNDLLRPQHQGVKN